MTHPVQRHAYLTVCTMLELSTAHLTPDTAQRIDSLIGNDELAGARWDYGWFLYVDDEVADQKVPTDLAACFRFAQQHGYHWVRFDRDAVAIAALPVYEWP